MSTVTFQNGNKEVTLTASSGTEWTGGENSRVYFDLNCTGKRSTVSKLYEVTSGSTPDHKITHGGRTFAFQYGIDANSNSKKAAIVEAIETLVKAL